MISRGGEGRGERGKRAADECCQADRESRNLCQGLKAAIGNRQRSTSRLQPGVHTCQESSQGYHRKKLGTPCMTAFSVSLSALSSKHTRRHPHLHQGVSQVACTNQKPDLQPTRFLNPCLRGCHVSFALGQRSN